MNVKLCCPVCGKNMIDLKFHVFNWEKGNLWTCEFICPECFYWALKCSALASGFADIIDA
jgi:hypothetical protein